MDLYLVVNFQSGLLLTSLLSLISDTTLIFAVLETTAAVMLISWVGPAQTQQMTLEHAWNTDTRSEM